MAFGTDDGQTARSFYFRAQLDVRTTTGHVGSDGHCSLQTGFGYDVCFLLVQLGIQYAVLDLAHGQHLAQHFGDFYGCGTHQDRASGLYQLFDFFDDCFIFLAFRLVNAVVHVFTGDGAVGGDHHYIQFVDVPEFACFRFGSTGHTREFVVHTEVILQRNGGECLCGGFHFYVFLGFDGLVQTVGIAAAFHDTACLLVHNLHLTVDHNVFVIFLEHGVSLQQLVDGVYTFGLDGIVGHQFIFLGQALLVRQTGFVFQFGKLCGDVGQYEEGRIFRVTGDQVHTFICQVYTVQLFFDDEVQRVGSFVHTLVVLLHVDLFGLQHTCLDTLFTQIFNQCLVLGQCLVAAEQSKETFFLIFLVAGSNQALGIGKILGSQFLLCFHQTFYERTQLLEQLVLTFGDGTGNNQRSTGIVNQYGVHLIDDGIVVLALYEVFGADGHIITQVVETEFVVRTEGDVCQISLTACVGVGLMSVDAVHT